MAKQIILTQNDYGICVESQFMIDKKNTIDLSGYAVEIVIVCPDNTKLYRNGQIIDASNGVVDYIIIQEDTIQVGLYKMYISIVDYNENVTAQNELYYYVKALNGGV